VKSEESNLIGVSAELGIKYQQASRTSSIAMALPDNVRSNLAYKFISLMKWIVM